MVPSNAINSIKHQSFVYIQLNDQTALFITIHFSICSQSKCQTLIGSCQSYYLGQSNGHLVELHIRQTYRTGASPSYSLISYPGHSFGEALTLLQRCIRCILLPQPTGLLLTGVIFPSIFA